MNEDLRWKTNIDDYYNITLESNTGSVSNSCLPYKFKNIDMKVLLSDIYEKYDRYNIRE